ncbi:DedA family protein [Terrabacter sp. MAHUQ-38]|jgi:membrane protein DedA with SNARE-associated domain|uniref:DedA family protein n=1 Tax=unclassified Terrabacter TaxID=2630222 RepID=UPI00165EB99F|nr:DedA family protein [Terrabacter sp. MAHUQ-38]MBC9823571.1 DedA family protein [Terrabacter sp. MAHUQ-38]
MTAPALLLALPTAELSGLVGIASRVIRTLGEWGVAALTFVETVLPPIPSEVVLPLSGFIARQGQMSLALLLVTSTLGSYLGAMALYLLASRLGQARAIALLARLPLVDRSDFVRTTAWFADHGRRSVFFGRLVPGVRSLVSLPAGAVHMPILRFTVFTVAGSAIWNGLLIGLGWLLGSRYELVDRYSSVLDVVVVTAVAALVAWLVARRVRRGRADRTSPRATEEATERASEESTGRG